MLESGCVSLKNEVNIMMKNVVDVVLGGITYWAFGYGLRDVAFENAFFVYIPWHSYGLQKNVFCQYDQLKLRSRRNNRDFI